MAEGSNKRPRRRKQKTDTPASAEQPQQPIPADVPAVDKAKPVQMESRERSARQSQDFQSRILDRTVIAIPLLEKFDVEQAQPATRSLEPPEVYQVIIDLNLDYPDGRAKAREVVAELATEAIAQTGGDPQREGINQLKGQYSDQYVFGSFTSATIRKLIQLDQARAERAIFRIWPDFKVKALINKSVSTVKADAARVSFSALGEGIVWAVLDSGIDDSHPHFKKHENLQAEAPLQHRDFTVLDATKGQPCLDEYGHGTHVAGIIAGEMAAARNKPIHAISRRRDENGEVTFSPLKDIETISGMAPKCKLLSLKVLDENGEGDASSLIAAINYIQELNGYGRRLLVHGVNMSVGYEFDPEWFACGQSPLCVEVDRLVRSGVVVVVAAGNSGYGWAQTEPRGPVNAGLDLTINDPGNAELAITVGSTHRNMPHIYGVSYFSSKGPTGDGRLKPDLVAPGEKIVSCAAGVPRKDIETAIDWPCDYREDSGTSMAAPHVSGVIAAFLSVRQEFIGKPETVKQIFLATATDLKRDRYFQGHGLIDLMRAIQSV
ncbi:MAG TPA: S8 family peptidase [Herpetosiphonaceae bacterium]